jgi:ubiquitin carboxyl-terminal hydrolase 7
VVSSLFVGQVENYIRTLHVPFEKLRAERFYDLSLDIKGRRSVMESLLSYVEPDLLEGENRYRADEHGLQDAEKGVAFTAFPPVLQLQLKRYDYDVAREQMVKLGDRLDFSRRLDLRPFIPPGEAQAEQGEDPAQAAAAAAAGQYLLHAVVIHVGDEVGGHYYTYVDPRCDGNWHRFDDQAVTKVSERVVFEDGFGGGGGPLGFLFGRRGKASKCAYMLQYVQASRVKDLLVDGAYSQLGKEGEAPPAAA